jgi:hypothetical protein
MIADQEKCSRDMVEVQYLENPFRGGGAGPVIKGEVEIVGPAGTPRDDPPKQGAVRMESAIGENSGRRHGRARRN